jgi:hypothetical protein
MQKHPVANGHCIEAIRHHVIGRVQPNKSTENRMQQGIIEKFIADSRRYLCR